jgi:hypothetical protein
MFGEYGLEHVVEADVDGVVGIGKSYGGHGSSFFKDTQFLCYWKGYGTYIDDAPARAAPSFPLETRSKFC